MNADAKKWEAAAERLLAAIPSPTAQQVYRETAQQLGIPLWMLITGLLQRCYDNGEHTAPVLDPAWTFGNPVERTTMPVSICQHCGREYTPRWIGQEFCDAKCGAYGQLARRAATPAPDLVRYQVGAEPPGVAKSTINSAEASGHGEPGPQPAQERKATGRLGRKSEGETDAITAIEREAQAALGA